MTSSTGNSFSVTGPLQGESFGHGWIPLTWPVKLSFDFFMYAWPNSWANSRYAGNLRHHCAHYDVIVTMLYECPAAYLCDALENDRSTRGSYYREKWLAGILRSVIMRSMLKFYVQLLWDPSKMNASEFGCKRLVTLKWPSYQAIHCNTLRVIKASLGWANHPQNSDTFIFVCLHL